MSSKAALGQEILDDTKLIENYINDCKIRGMSRDSIHKYRSPLLIFLSFLRHLGAPLVSVDRDILREFIQYLRDERGVKQRTIEYYFSTLSSFYEYMEYEGFIVKNPVLAVRKRYLRQYKDNRGSDSARKLISFEEMKLLINSILDARDKAIITLLAKTGIRRGELLSIDVEDINWVENSITLKPKAKRSNRLVFFDDETARILKRWIRLRELREPRSKALFIGETGNRLQRNGAYTVVTKHAQRVGLHDPDSDKMEDHFSPHCCRHWFTTHLRRAGMKREFIQELRGDRRRDAIDIYDHIDKEELREAYLAHIPQLGI
ncbi:MAG: tyrosine-type recombinase/integrase [archaeon]|nr:tyrosine-type recombinase/integrase [archaeon]